MADSNPPSPPSSLPKYLAKGLPKQDIETLRDVRGYVEDLIEEKKEAVEEDDLPKGAEVVDEKSDNRGTIVQERVKCGADCTCNDGNGHGPYLYAYRWEGGKLVSEYIGKPSTVD